MLNILNLLDKRNKILITATIILIVIAIPLTIFQAQTQQEIRQRAARQQVSLYFAERSNCNNRLSNLEISTNASLCLDTAANGISGFNIILSANNYLIFQSATRGADASKFTTSNPQIMPNSQTLEYRGINTNENVTSIVPLLLLNFTVEANGNGQINISTSEIASLGQSSLLAVTTPNSPLSYSANATTAPPTPTSTPVRGNQGGNEECFVHVWSSNPSCSGSWDGSYDSSCGTYSSSDIGICTPNGVGGSQQVASCGACAPPPPTSAPIPTTPSTTSVPGDTTIQFQGLPNSIFTNKNGDLISQKSQDLIIYIYRSDVNTANDLKGNNSNYKKEVLLSFNNGVFSIPTINFGKIPPGQYKILIKSSKYLRRLVATVSISSSGSIISISPNTTLADSIGDVNNDNVLDIIDYNSIASCFEIKRNTLSCQYKDLADLNDDGNIDGIDYNMFLRSISSTKREGD